MNPPARTRGPLHDDGPLPDLISGLMWLATSVVGVAVLAIPGTPRPHLAVVLVLAGLAAGWGGLSLWLGLTARTMTIAPPGERNRRDDAHYLKHRLLAAEAVQRGMAERDPLTGLYNRRSFDHALARSADEASAALVLFDFDGFKAVNDEHGHPIGDAVLRSVADACARVVRDGDCLARIGGDEFALVAPGAAGAGVERIVEALAAAIADAPSPDGVPSVQVTFASAVVPQDATDPGELFRVADERLLARKRDAKRLARAA
jgi:diguanylate cyclase (GGDEF)-like protein